MYRLQLSHCVAIVVLAMAGALLSGETTQEALQRSALAAQQKWAVKNAAQRLASVGPRGQQDLFWQLLNLLEKESKARDDADLEVLLNHLLFEAGLGDNANTLEPALARLSAVHARLATRLYKHRLAQWQDLAEVDNQKSEIWQRPELRLGNPKLLAAAARELLEAGVHNPLLSLWYTLAVALAGEQNAAQQVQAARSAIQRSFPTKAAVLLRQAICGIADNGVKEALPLLLDECETLLQEDPSGESGISVMAQFSRLINDPPRGFPNVKRMALLRARHRLSQVSTKLQWNMQSRKFELAGSGEAHKLIYDKYKVTPPGPGADAARKVLVELIQRMETQPDAAKDAALAECIVALIPACEMRWDPVLTKKVYIEFPKLNREGGLKAWTALVRNEMYSGEGAAGQLWRLRHVTPGYDAKLVAEARRQVAPEYMALYQALPADDIDSRFEAALGAMLLGAPVTLDDIRKLLAEACKLGALHRFRLYEWSTALCESGQSAGLHLLLLSARHSGSSRAHDCGAFERLVGKPEKGMNLFQMPEDKQLARIDEHLKWLEQNERNLEWDADKSVFKLREGAAAQPAQADF